MWISIYGEAFFKNGKLLLIKCSNFKFLDFFFQFKLFKHIITNLLCLKTEELQRRPNSWVLFKKVHMKKDGTFVDAKSKQVNVGSSFII